MSRMSKFTIFISHYTLCRWRLGYMSFMAALLMQILRSDLSMALVCMLKPTNHSSGEVNLTGNNKLCSSSEYGPFNKTYEEEFEWSNTLQSNMVAGYFYGYMATNVLGGVLADKYGGKIILGTSLLSASILSLLHPVLTRISEYFTLVLRILTGLASGPIFPTIQSLWGRWDPPQESSILNGISFTGQGLGCVLGLTIGGFLCEHGFDNGWGSIFYIFGGTSLVFSCLWFYIVYDNPDLHPSITQEERSYINSAITSSTSSKKVKVIPKKKILTSSAVWVICSSCACFAYLETTFQLLFPLYMKDVFNVSPASNGLISSVPCLVELIAMPLFAYLADFLFFKNYLSKRSIRVIFQSISFIGCVPPLIAIGFLNCNQTTLTVVMLFVFGVFVSSSIGGFLANPLDIAPNYAGVLFGIVNTFGCISGIVAPLVAKLLTPNGSRDEWQIYFLLCAVLVVLGTIIFAISSKGEVEKWAQD